MCGSDICCFVVVVSKDALYTVSIKHWRFHWRTPTTGPVGSKLTTVQVPCTPSTVLVRRTVTIVQVPCTLTTVIVRRTLNTVRVPCTVTNVLVRRTLTIVPLHCTPTIVPVRCTLTAVLVNWKIAPVINTTPDGGLVRGTLTKLLPVFQLPGRVKTGTLCFLQVNARAQTARLATSNLQQLGCTYCHVLLTPIWTPGRGLRLSAFQPWWQGEARCPWMVQAYGKNLSIFKLRKH